MSKIEKGNYSVTYWSVADIYAAVEKATSLGGIIFSPVNNVGGTTEVAIIADPFGNHIGFITGA
jgi:predicted enzyme related to lactoylglutathione lyase